MTNNLLSGKINYIWFGPCMSPTAPPLMQNGVNLIMKSSLNLNLNFIINFRSVVVSLRYSFSTFKFPNPELQTMPVGTRGTGVIAQDRFLQIMYSPPTQDFQTCKNIYVYFLSSSKKFLIFQLQK